MVAEGMFCQQLLGMKPDAARMGESAGIVRSNLPRRSQINYYYWYYDYGYHCWYSNDYGYYDVKYDYLD